MSSDAIRDIRSRLEPFFDDFLIEEMRGAERTLHRPVPRNEVLVTDRPWEGNACGFLTVFRDGEIRRMYYKAWNIDLGAGGDSKREVVESHPLLVAYAESEDGIQWRRPEVGLIEFAGSVKNNIVWRGAGPEEAGAHGFAPFQDANPTAPARSAYKALGSDRNCARGLFAMESSDGLRWSLMREEPILTGCAFDSQNLAFWDLERGEYRAYVRDFRHGRRCIRTAVSSDFLHWSDPEWLEYPGAPDEQLYTNQILPYYRAPHIFIGFPTRYVERKWSPSIEALPELEHRRLRAGVGKRLGAALTDGLFMTSRDGRTFHRWPEAFLRPGPQQRGNWAYGDNYQGWGLLETASDLPGSPPEISLYSTENYWRAPGTVFRRYTLRLDGFVSVHAALGGGELITRPIRFEGDELFLNAATSAAGSVTVEIRDRDGRPLPGYQESEFHEIIGDDVKRRAVWRQGPSVRRVAGRPVRLRFRLRDADLYALQFK